MKNIKTKYRILRKTVWVFILLTLWQAWEPTAAWALTSGPGDPSFASFEPVATTNMVNEFSGDFTYNLPVLNIPGANGGGYALSLSYHSGSSPEEEASWVGYGWTLNPGSINRGKRGLPDDYDGASVTYYNQAPDNQTASVSGVFQPEGFSLDAPVSATASLSYNNYKGFSYDVGAGIALAGGMITLGFGISNGETSFSAQVNPGDLLSMTRDQTTNVDNSQSNVASSQGDNKKDASLQEQNLSNKNSGGNQSSQSSGGGTGILGEGLALLGSNYGNYTHELITRPTQFPMFSGNSYDVSVTMMPTPIPVEVGINGSVAGNYTYQHNAPSTTIPAFGYMYSGFVSANENAMMDYSVEKLKAYKKWDTHLGIPYSSPDDFLVTGEGLEGSFRLRNTQAGWFHPAPVTSKFDIYNLGAAVELGLNVGIGANLGVGFENLSITNFWDAAQIGSYPFASSASLTEPYFFMFNNDMGGDAYFSASDAPQQATWDYTSILDYAPNVNSINVPQYMNGGSRSGRSSYIAYHTNAEMVPTEGGKVYMPYSRGTYISQFIDRTESDIGSGIGEFAIFNQDGNLYTYGLPVYSRNETNLQYNLDATAGNVKYNYLVYEDVSSSNKNINTKVGQEEDVAYASTHLLTSITTPDYVDRTMDGPTADDFGGWTKFSYQRLWGTQEKNTTSLSNWYHWRIPYTGLLYHPNSLSTQTDDMGSVSSGYKEAYYMDTIQTKTHYAVFRVSGRNDAFDASDDVTAAMDSTAKGTHSMVRLNRIDLYAKNNGSPQLVESVHFEYDTINELCVGAPNANTSHGKLTLKRVWFDYNGAMNARISPYQFQYTYSKASYPAPYTNDYASLYTATQQNPKYSYFELDPWGHYQYNGYKRYNLMQNWVNQNPSDSLDPAAWQLKVITLPSGGQIHVQYEQKDYSYVQDQPAHAMVSLLGPNSGYLASSFETTGSDILNNKYYLQLHDIGIDSADQGAVDSVVSLLRTYYVQPKRKLYFKYLYALVGTNPSIGPCNSDYITGYSDVFTAGMTEFSSGTFHYYRPFVVLGKYATPLLSGYYLPRNVGIDFYRTQRMGNLNPFGNCDPTTAGVNMNNKSPIDIVIEFLTFLGTAITGSIFICDQLNFSESYLKIPLPLIKPKLGGGIRVKKLLMYDPGLETGDAVLYGNQYTYKTESGYSSGVAVNEPGAIREENALVQFDPQARQTFLEKIVAGIDKDLTELPYYETLLPGASIGYSRVVVQNIYSGNTNPGFTVDEYYTAQDYPITSQNTSINTEKHWTVIPAFITSFTRNNLWASQGFSVTMNNMHGQVKSQTTFEGSPSNIQNATISTQQVYSYYQPGELIPLMGTPNSVYYSIPGKESETVLESRGVEDINNNVEVQFDVDVGLVPFPPFVLPFYSIVPYYSYSESKLYTNEITNVIHYPAMVKSVYSYADGISHTTQNLAFSPSTGKVVMSRTTDGFNQVNLQKSTDHAGSYTNYNYPACQEYSSMGQRAANERAIITSSATVEIKKEAVSGGPYSLLFIPASGQSVCSVMSYLYPGDLVRLTDKTSGTDYGIFNITDSIVGDNLFMYPTLAYGTNIVGNGLDVSIQVIRSGRTNQLSTSTGSFTTYGDTTSASTIGITAAQLVLREKFAHQLDSCYQINKDYTSTAMPSGIDILSPITGNCISAHDSLTQGINCDSRAGTLVYPYFDKTITCTLPFKVGNFGIDPLTDQLAFYAPGNLCHPSEVCLTFCPTPLNTNRVIQADAKTFNDVWPYDPTIFPVLSGSNLYENGTKGKWRGQSNYAYKDTIIAANGTNRRIYANAGVFPLQTFSWPNLVNNDTTKWIKLNTVTQYSPDGNDMEESDIMGIYSTAKFGYNHTQPYLVAKNSNYASAMFESFENVYNGNALEDNWQPVGIATKIDATTAHAGSASWKLVTNDSLNFKPMTYTSQMQNTNLLVETWVKDTTTVTKMPIIGRIKNASSGTTTFSFQYVARTGQWTLYQATIDSTHFAQASVSLNSAFTIYVKNDYSSATNWLDDVRVQPAEAEMNAYVYDTRLRLITSFDDQNFGVFYQYNGEGKLVRKLLETTEGIRSISESEYHSHEQLRQ